MTFLDNLLQDAETFKKKKKKVELFWDSATPGVHRYAQFWFGVQFPLKADK